MNRPSAQQIAIPISLGELVDKLTILEIKKEKITDQAKLANVAYELQLLHETLGDQYARDQEFQELRKSLRAANMQLWEIEDRIRECERRKQFDQVFVELARSVYKINDIRAALKRDISLQYGSSILEEKSYSSY